MDFLGLKSRYLKEWRNSKREMINDTGMRLSALARGKDPEEFIKEVR